jgi:hypothetical protein
VVLYVIHYRDIGVIGAFAEEAEKSLDNERQTAICWLPSQTTVFMSLWERAQYGIFFSFKINLQL